MTDTTHKEVYVENQLQRAMFILNPAIQEQYKEITKDLSLSHLDPFQLKICIFRQEIINIAVLPNCIEWLPNSFESFMRDQHTTLELCKSKFGFQAKLERSTLSGNVEGEKNFEKVKPGMFNK